LNCEKGLPVIKKTRQVASPSSPDGLDEEIWQRLADVLAAANRGDDDTFLKLLKRIDAGWSDHMRNEASIYLFYLLKYRIVEMLARRPDAGDLHAIAVRIHECYARVVREPAATLEDTLRAVFDMAPTGPQESGARLFVSGVAAAGVLFNDPSSDLTVIRPHLAEWRFRSA
jgi:hypothetical protein